DIASNIRMFDQKMTDLQIKQAAEFVQADKFIADLPETYHQPVSERGMTYSAGQRQLLAFARTIVRDPKI
ncbi:ATP-binding cassette domain-containing protein, partial [Liquorilactobacillus vini]